MKCPKCQIFLPDDALFCFKCGEKLSSKPDHIDLKTGVEGERKRLTALFSDLSGYTAMTAKLDPEEIMEITGRIFDGVKAVVKKYEGFIERFAGDGVLVLLGIPKAHEDDPIRAIHAAREIHRLVDFMSPQYEKKIGRPLSMHSGINTGLVVTAVFNPEKGTHDSAGDAINVAARLSDIAGAGEILVGHETYKASRNHFAFLQLSPVSIKGKNDPILIYKLKSVSPFAARFRRGRQVSSSMVGRKRELERLALQVLKAVNGEGSIVNIIGEAGIGKSRLVAELKKMERVESIEFLEGSAISIGRNLSFYPIIELLKKWARIREDDGEAMAYGRLEAAVRSLYPEKAAEILPFVAILMGMKLSGTYAERVRGIEGEALEKLILKNMRLLLTKATEISPLIVVIDDLHWADNSTIELIQSLFHLVETQRIVYINVFRPNHPETGDQIVAYVKENLPDYYAELMIEPLNEEMSQALISNMLRIKDLKHIVLGQIISRAGGNPFFIEEVVRSFIDESVVVLKNGRFEITEKIDQMVIPDKIIDVLMARIDRLDEETRRLVKVASVIGRNFFYKIIKEVAVQVEDIDSKLASLKELQLIRERKRMDEIEFLFKHALAQEVAYESILHKKRKKLHLRVARSIEKTFTKRLHEFYGLLAYHYSNGEDLDKAEDYLIKAGEEALRSSASSEALKYYQQGLELYLLKHGDDAEPEKLAKFEKNIALALYNRGNLESALEYFDKVLNRWGAGTSNNTLLIPFKVLFDLLGVVSRLYFFKKRGKRIPDTLENEIFNLRYKKAVSLVHLDPEKCFIEFMSTLNRLRKYDTTKIENGIGMWMSGSGLFSWTGISFKLSIRMLDYNKPIINKEDSKEVLYYDLFELLHHSFVGKWLDVKEYDQNLVESNLKIGEFWHTATYLLFHGYINIGQGEFEKVETILSKLNEISKDYGNENGTEFWYTLKIQLLITFGEMHSALKLVDEGILFLAKTGRESVIIYYLGLKATIQVLSNDFGQAEETMKRIKERKSGKIRLLPIYISSYRLARFIFNLHFLEQSILKHDKSNILKYRKKAYQSGNCALKNSKKFAFSRTELFRLMGSYYWLIGKNKKAFGQWIRGIKEAEQLGARVEHARILMEIGRHLHDVKSKNTEYHGFSADDYLEKARLFFEEKGLDQDLTRLAQIGAS
jgi:class 3 adenylate cyclase/tetratricopeptide (TPR) repeat protein